MQLTFLHFAIQPIFGAYTLRPCERRNIPTFVFLQNLKHRIFFIFPIFGIYHIKIEFLFSRNSHSDSNFNWIFDYDYGMQGLSILLFQKVILYAFLQPSKIEENCPFFIAIYKALKNFFVGTHENGSNNLFANSVWKKFLLLDFQNIKRHIYAYLLSISSTFYAHVFVRKCFFCQNVTREKLFSMKNARIKCWWNWHPVYILLFLPRVYFLCRGLKASSNPMKRSGRNPIK